MATEIGNDLNNWLVGSDGADVIKGYGGNDVLQGRGGADYLDGGTGLDLALYWDSPAGVAVDLTTGTGSGGHAQGDMLFRIENIWGSSYRDVLVGNHHANELYGVAGDDVLYGRAGADALIGGIGNDHLDGGVGDDVLDGGPGSDTASFYDSPSGVTVTLSDGTAISDHGRYSLIGIENLSGSMHGDALEGDGSGNAMYGLSGLDVLKGYGGNDVLYGGDDVDALNGGMSSDVLHGGNGGDYFSWSSTDDTGMTSGTPDVILDFSFAEEDQIHLRLIDADVYAADDQAFTFIGAAPFTGTPGEINYVHQNGETIIQMQTGMSADVEGIIRIAGIVTPEAGWFVL